MPEQLWTRDGYTISTQRERLDTRLIHRFLTTSYWAEGIPLNVVEHSLEHSLPSGLYDQEQQVGFARVITDYATFAYVADVFILQEYRGRGLSKWLMETVIGHPDLQGLRRWILFTRDAHGLYTKVGLTPPRTPQRLMERLGHDLCWH
jgi:GNAT superfamily N-acetyltransferase